MPQPDDSARAHSARVVDAVRAEIAACGGWIAFARYMQIVLYAPGAGYYTAGARKFGPVGDFVTAPEMTPLFAQALAAPITAILDGADARDVLELGAGSGALADGLLAHVTGIAHYRILDLSADLQERQRARLTAHTSANWLDALPATIDGAVVMNEVLDAVPPHLVVRRAGDWYERGVAFADGRLQWAERPLADTGLRALAESRFPADGDYESEINPAAEALVETLGRRLRSGAIVLIDYGFPAAEYYHPQRTGGTLMGHYRHRAHADPFLWPGLSDLTAHVDFTAIALAAERAGLAVAGYGPLAGFLVGAGILDRLQAVGDPASAAYVREAAAVQRLLSPAEMGELFKVMVLAKSDSIVCPYFEAADRTHRL
ncbi:MAG: SAM-dependent methyltransferase [Burkholderiales bacterium]|nr:SAM-dependent methyltransferase [Burkholderiales bacterium]